MFQRPLLVVFVVQIFFIGIWYHISGAGESEAQQQFSCVCEGKIEEIRVGTKGNVIVIDEVRIQKTDTKEVCQNNQLIVYDYSGKNLFFNTKIGNRILIQGKFSTFKNASNPGGFDELAYYQSQGIDGKVFAEQLNIIGEHCDLIQQRLYLLRQNAMKNLLSVMTEEDAGILGAMLLGEKAYLPERVKERFQKSGIGHLLAISGLHISLLGAALFFFLRSYCMEMKKAVLVTVFFLFVYGEFTGFPIATERAVLMMTCSLFARYTGRCYDPFSAMALSGVFTLLQQPLQLFQCGFLLSYAATAGIVLLDPLQKEIKSYFKGKTIGKGLESALGCGLMFLVTIPPMLWFFYELCPYSVLANVIILPLLSLLVGVGVIGCVVGFVWQSGAGFVLSTAHYILRFYELVCEGIEKLPQSTWVIGRPTYIWIVLYYVVLFGCVFLYCRWKNGWIVAGGACFIAGFLFAASPSIPFRYIQLDVGQGDCAVVMYGNQTYLIDGGSSSEKEIGKYTIQKCLKYYGRSRIDAVFLTHSDSDHTNGVTELVLNRENWGIDIDQIVMPKMKKIDSGYQELLSGIQKCGIPVKQMGKGDRITTGELQIRCLHPFYDYEWESENDYSLTLDIFFRGVSILTTGDLEESGEATLDGLREKYDFLKVGHHGSKSSSSQEFLDQICPRYAIISVGEKNRYGHPHGETIKRLEATGSKILRTDELGAIILTISPSGEVKKEGYRRSVGQGSQ